MRIAVGSDHAGFEDPKPYYKPAIIEHLKSHGHEVIDCGTEGPDSVDYPDFAEAVASAVLESRADCGVLVCGTGIGICMAANRHKGIRAAPVTTDETARLSRTHNNANIICFGRRILTLEECIRLLDIWLDTPYSHHPRHDRRIEKMG
ncbi:MAG TPA: ribose 5-phosphate isomerase B [Candidatus Hydrogenedentes bacterium]|nr:ribose 5-phosphate isomerase B [Candidatus Hydrogenedentota bacterium]HRK35586.1 ribose 5-phosphate isomerase B [Candidatus Hydrogenedentota bacterium]